MSSETGAVLRLSGRHGVVAALLAVFGVVAGVLVWQALERPTPTIFTDELEMTQISRAIADTGHPARRGVSYGFTTLVPWLTAPFWWIGPVGTAYGAIRVTQAIAMAATVFPAYAIARHVVTRPWAVAAAALSVCVPALAYAPILKEEAFGYPASACAILLLIRGVARPTRWSLALALLGCIVAAAVRTQLLALVPVWALTVAVVAWRSDRFRAWRRRWSRGEWIAAWIAVPLVLVLAYVAAAVASTEVEVAAREQRAQMLEYGVWAVGAWAIGVGIAPAIALLAVLVRPAAVRSDPRVTAFGTVAAGTLAMTLAYAAVKAAAISAVLGPLIVERNVIYLTPLAAASLACLLSRRDAPWWAIAVATGLVLWVVTRTPVELNNPYFESHGVAVMAWANTELQWVAETIRTVRWIVVLGAGALALLLCAPGAPRRATAPIAAFLLCATLAWGIVGEVHADTGERQFAQTFDGALPKPRTWIDRASGGRAVTVLGQEMARDPNLLSSTEFWNRSITHVWSVDGTAPGPGPTLTPDLADVDGTLAANAGTPFALALPGVDLVGREVAEQRGWRVVRLQDGVLRLRSSSTGIGEGSWTGPFAAFNRFDASAEPATVDVTLSRKAFCAQVAIPSEVQVSIGALAIGPDKQPAIGSVRETRSLRVTPCNEVTVRLPTPGGPWRIEIRSDTFVPREIDPSLPDTRQLGVQAALAP